MEKIIYLKKMCISNWRGRNIALNFDKHNVLSGRNESGKSTTKNAFFWLLTGVDEMNISNYKLFDDRVPVAFENRKTARVEATIEIDGQKFVLAKEATPGWTRKRGSATYEKKSSDDYAFYIDGIAYSAKSYKEFIESNIAPIDILKMMLNTDQYLLLDWKDLRKHFEAIAGKITEDDMQGDYSMINDLLVKYGNDIDNIRTVLKSKINSFKEIVGTETSKGVLKIQIETLKSNLPDISDFDECQRRAYEITKHLDEVKSQMLGLSDSIQPFIEKRNKELLEIGKLKDEADTARTAYIAAYNDKIMKLKDEIAHIDAYNKDVDKFNENTEFELVSAKKCIHEYEKRLEVLNNIRSKLLEENKGIKSLVFTGVSCPYCGQLLPEDKLEAERDKFNQNKERQHRAIVEQGKANNIKIEDVKAQIAKLQETINAGITKRQYKDKSELEKELNDLTTSYIPYEETTDCKGRIAAISLKTSKLTIIPKVDIETLKDEERKLNDELVDVRVKLKTKDGYEKQMEKIRKLEDDLKANAVELAEYEGKLAKVNEYERERAKLISDGVNGNFHFCHIEMTEPKKDGGLVNTCIVKDHDNVNARVANRANKILCGIDIALGLQTHYGLSLPLFIDDSDLINKDNLPNIDGQTILLSVSENDLNIEPLC